MWMHVDNGDFYDFSGPAANYSNNEDGDITHHPAILGKALQFTFTSFNTERSFDKFYVYDGTSTSATLIGTFSGTTNQDTITVTSPDGALTFRFLSLSWLKERER